MNETQNSLNEQKQPVHIAHIMPSTSFSLIWKNAEKEPPKESGRYWCIVEEQNDLGKSHFQWNCCYGNVENMWSDSGKFYNVIWWTELAPFPF